MKQEHVVIFSCYRVGEKGGKREERREAQRKKKKEREEKEEEERSPTTYFNQRYLQMYTLTVLRGSKGDSKTYTSSLLPLILGCEYTFSP